MADPTTATQTESTAPTTQPQSEKPEVNTSTLQQAQRLHGGVTKPAASKARRSSGKARRKKEKKKHEKKESPHKLPIILPSAKSARLHGAVPPWVLRSSTARALLSGTDRLAALDAELADFALYSRATPGETERRDAALAHVRSVVESMWKGTRVDVFGSVSTGLCAPGSDIDLSVEKEQVSRKAASRSLLCLKKALKARGEGTPFSMPFGKSEVVGDARVPVLKLYFACGTSVDICFGMKEGLATRDTILKYLDMYGDAVRPIFYVVKEALVQIGLNDVSRSGLGSYTLFNMVVFHVQRHGELFPYSDSGAGTMLRDFFTLWVSKIDVATTGVCIADGGYTYNRYARFGSQKKHAVRPTYDDAHDRATRNENATANAVKKDKKHTRSGFGVQDVNNNENELGSNCWQLQRVIRLFKLCEVALTKWLDSKPKYDHPSALSAVIAVTDSMKKRREEVVRNKVDQGTTGVLLNAEDAGQTSSPKGNEELLPGASKEDGCDVMAEAEPQRSLAYVENETQRSTGEEHVFGIKVDDTMPASSEEKMKQQCGGKTATKLEDMPPTSAANIESNVQSGEKSVEAIDVDVEDTVSTLSSQGVQQVQRGGTKRYAGDLKTDNAAPAFPSRDMKKVRLGDDEVVVSDEKRDKGDVHQREAVPAGSYR